MSTRQLVSSAEAPVTGTVEDLGRRHSWLLILEVVMTSREPCSCPMA